MIEVNLGDSESSVEAMMQTRVSVVGVGSQGGLPRGCILSLKEWELGQRVDGGCSRAMLKGRVHRENCPYVHFQLDFSAFAPF